MMRSKSLGGLRDRARRVSILVIARRLGLGEPVRCGPEWLVLCPFHDDHHPSLSLNEEEHKWYCFACEDGKDGINLVMRVKGMKFVDAIRWIVYGD
jgi:DNA primase